MPFEKFLFDYTSGSPIDNANTIWTHISQRLNTGKKVAIIYSANNEQAVKFHNSYYSRKLDNIISENAKNQAKIFRNIISLIKDERKYDRVHILPLSTSMRGGNNIGDNVVAEEIIIRDLAVVRDHLKDGWHVMVLTNPPHLQQLHGFEFQIGGFRAANFYNEENLIPFLTDSEALSQGKCVERVLNSFFEIENCNYITPRIRDLERALDQYFFGSLRIQPHKNYAAQSLEQYLCDALNINPNAIRSIRFSKSYNLRIVCASEETKKLIINELSPYGAEDLNTVRMRILHEQQLFATMAKDNLTVSIGAEYVFNVLHVYCKIPIETIAGYLEKVIAQNCGYKSVQIMAQGIRIDGQFFSLKQCLEQNKFNHTGQKLKVIKGLVAKNGEIKVNNIWYALQGINDLLLLQMQKKFPALNPITTKLSRLLYKPYMPINMTQENQHRDFDRVIDLVNVYTRAQSYSTKNNKIHLTDPCIAKRIQDMINYHYDSLSKDAIDLFSNFTEEDILNAQSSINNQIKRLSVKIREFIVCDVELEADELVKIFKVWLYLQVASIAHIRVNTFLSSIIISTLNQYKNSFVLLPSNNSKLLQALSSEMKNTEIVRLTNLYVNQYGIALPQLGVYNGRVEISKEIGKRKVVEERMLRCFRPVIQAIKELQIGLPETKLAQDIRVFNPVKKDPYNFIYQKIKDVTDFANYLNNYSLDILSIFTVASSILKLKIIDRSQDEIIANILKLRANSLPDTQVLLFEIFKGTEINWWLFEGLLYYGLIKFDHSNLSALINALKQKPINVRKQAYDILDHYLTGCDSLYRSIFEFVNIREAISESAVSPLIPPAPLNVSRNEPSIVLPLVPPSYSNINRNEPGSLPQPSPLIPPAPLSMNENGSVVLSNSPLISPVHTNSITAEDENSHSDLSSEISDSQSSVRSPIVIEPIQRWNNEGVNERRALNAYQEMPRQFAIGESRNSLFGAPRPRADHLQAQPPAMQFNNRLNPFFEAVISADERKLERVLNGLIDVNQKIDFEGRIATALHWAVKNKSLELILILLTHGADTLARDDTGKTPLDWAREHGFEYISLVRDMFRDASNSANRMIYHPPM